MIVTIISYIIIGLIVGALGRLVVPGRNPMGILMTIGLGVVGALLGGLVIHYTIGGGHGFIQFLVSVVVAGILVALVSGSKWGRRGVRQ